MSQITAPGRSVDPPMKAKNLAETSGFLGLWRMGFALLTPGERKKAVKVFALTMIAAVFSVALVGSVMPFLAVLSDPGRTQDVAILAFAYDFFGFTSTYSFLVGLGVLSLAVILVATMCQVLKLYAIIRFSNMRVHSLSCRLMAKYMGQNYEYFLNRHSDKFATRILSETQQYTSTFLQPAAEAVAATQTIVLIVTFLIWVDPAVTVLAFALFGSAYALTYYLSRFTLKRLGETRMAANTERFRVAGEAFEGTKDIKVLGRETRYLQKFATSSNKMARASCAIQLFGGLPRHVVQAVGFCGIIILCLLLINPSQLDSQSTLGTLIPLAGVFAVAGQRLSPELSRLYHSSVMISSSRAIVETLYEDLVDYMEVARPVDEPKRMGLSRQIELTAVDYRYPEAENVALSDVSLSIRAGERIGIVGGTGSGKTTLVDLVLGLLEPVAGQIAIDGEALTSANIRAWQQSVGYVPQNIFLSDATIAENIALAIPKEDIDRDRIVHACKVARLDEFITEQLPQGYETMIGERGVRLSGGQRQRLGIARAIYNNADLIVFDEATSALDNLTEREVMDAIRQLPGGTTIIIIAHRLSTVKFCEKIVVLDGGKVSSVGDWDELEASSLSFNTILNPQHGAVH